MENLTNLKQLGQRLQRYIFVFAALPLIFGVISAQTVDSRTYERLAIKAYQAKDTAAFLEYMLQADKLNPGHPRITYNLAVAYTVNGKPDNAIALLNKLAEMKLFYPLDKDADLLPLKDDPKFRAAARKITENSMPTGNARQAFAIPEKGLVAESVAFDAKTQNFYLSSVAQRKILRIGKDGRTTEFANSADGLWSVFGIKIDAKNRVLWAASSAHKQMPDLKPEENGMTGLFKFDLDSGRMIKKYIVSDRTKPHLLGDLVVTRSGDVFATDSISPTIYFLDRSTDKIEKYLESPQLGSPQGLDIDGSGTFLFVADYSRGVFRIDLASKAITKLVPAENSTMLGIDGLYFYKNSLVATQNGVNPQRAVRMYLSKDLSRVDSFKVLEANNPFFDDITLGVLVGNDFYFIADSQWELLGDGGKLPALEKLKEVNVLKLSIDQ